MQTDDVTTAWTTFGDTLPNGSVDKFQGTTWESPDDSY